MAEKKAREVEPYLAGTLGAHRLYLVYGPDRGLVSERATIIARKTGLVLDDPFSVARLDGETVEQDPGRLIEEALQVSMFGGLRLVWLRQINNPAKLATAVQDLLERDLSQVFIIIEAAELAKSVALRTLVEKHSMAVALPCYADEARALDDLIDDVLSADGLAIDLDARRDLKALLGGDRMASRGEIEKLALYAAGEKRITPEMVAQAVGDASAVGVDSVIDAVLSGDITAMDADLTRIRAGKISGEAVIAILLRQFDTVERLRGAVEIGKKSIGDALNTARPPIFFGRRKMFETALGALTLEKIAQIQRRLEGCQLDMRRQSALADEISSQTLLAIAVDIRRGRQARFRPD